MTWFSVAAKNSGLKNGFIRTIIFQVDFRKSLTVHFLLGICRIGQCPLKVISTKDISMEAYLKQHVHRCLEKEMASHSSVLAWRIPWTEEPGGLQSMRLQELDMTEQLSTQHAQSMKRLHSKVPGESLVKKENLCHRLRFSTIADCDKRSSFSKDVDVPFFQNLQLQMRSSPSASILISKTNVLEDNSMHNKRNIWLYITYQSAEFQVMYKLKAHFFEAHLW